jgi:hypothetical protein
MGAAKIVLLAGAAVLILLVGLFFGWEQVNEARYRALESELRTQLTVGLTADQVQAYLAARGIGYTYYEQDRVIQAFIPDFYANPLIRTSVEIIGHVDQDGRLERLEIRRVGTSL